MKNLISTITKICLLLALSLFITLPGTENVRAADMNAPDIMHPIMQPQMYTKDAKCSNCGMMRNMWARTRYDAKNSSGAIHTCSIHCLADIQYRSGKTASDVMVAVYSAPEKMIPAADAYFVIGSTAKGTMTMESKIAFATKEDAENFAARYGGEVTGFDAALTKATAQLDGARQKINMNRMTKGKIKVPDQEASCHVCGMRPANYPAHRSQILTKDNTTIHFCSTKCLIHYQSSPAKYDKQPIQTMSAWVSIYPDGGYDYAGGLYYVVGSSKMGPMGTEALAFRSQKDAENMVKENGGHILTFDQLNSEVISAR